MEKDLEQLRIKAINALDSIDIKGSNEKIVYEKDDEDIKNSIEAKEDIKWYEKEIDLCKRLSDDPSEAIKCLNSAKKRLEKADKGKKVIYLETGTWKKRVIKDKNGNVLKDAKGNVVTEKFFVPLKGDQPSFKLLKKNNLPLSCFLMNESQLNKVISLVNN